MLQTNEKYIITLMREPLKDRIRLERMQNLYALTLFKGGVIDINVFLRNFAANYKICNMMKKTIKLNFLMRAAMTLLTMMLTMMLTATTAWADNDAVSYIDMDGKTQTVTTYTEVTSAMTANGSGNIYWSTGTYVVKTSTTLNGSIRTRDDTVDLILCDGATLTVNGGSNGAFDGSTLNIYAQSTGTSMGVLTANGKTSCDKLNIAGGKVTFSGDSYGLYLYSGTGNGLTVNGGDVTIRNNDNYQGAIYCNGGDNFVTLNGGKLTVTNSNDASNKYAIYGTGTNTINLNGGTAVINGLIYNFQNINLNGGNVTVNGEIYNNSWGYTVTYDFTHATDSYYIQAFSSKLNLGKTRTVQVKDGVTFLCNGNSYSGTLSDNKIAAISGKTMTPDVSSVFAVSADGNTYTIKDAKGWDVFCDLLADNDKGYFTGKTVKLDANITVSRMAGGSYHDFTGTFNGQGNTLTFEYNATEAYAAPFRYVEGPSATVHAAIQNLNVKSTITGTNCRHLSGLIGLSGSNVDVSNCNVEVDITSNKGTDDNEMYPSSLMSQCTGPVTISGCTVTGKIETDGKYAAGILGIVQGKATIAKITNCVSSVTINSSTAGDGTHGGFVAVSYPGSTTIEGCLFNGKLLTVGTTDTKNCGGFVGWRTTGTVTISNSLYAPTDLDDGETEVVAGTDDYPSCTFVRNGSAGTNSYYTRALGNAQGKQARSITAGENVTIEDVWLTGKETSYDVSGITAYGQGGIKRTVGDATTLYYGEGDVLYITLSNTATGAPTGYLYDRYTASGGTLHGDYNPCNLTMPDADVIISINTAAPSSDGQQHEVSYVDAAGNGHTAQAVALDDTKDYLEAGTYFVGTDIIYNHTLELSGNVTLILCDGCTMNMGTEENRIKSKGISGSNYTLDIYAQSLGDDMGTLSIFTKNSNIRGIYVNALTINGGNVIANVTGITQAIYANGDITVNGGTVTATSTDTYSDAIYALGNFNFNGGTVTATANVNCYGIHANGNITLGWTNTSDRIYASSYRASNNGTVSVKSGQAFVTDDATPVVIRGTVSDLSTINGKTLIPHLLGDVNGDGNVNISDVIMVVNIILGNVTEYDMIRADVNGDDSVNISDAI